MSDYLKNWPSGKVLDFVKYVWNVKIFNLEPKKMWCFFAYVFCCYISSENFFHKHDIDNQIYMIIHVKKTVEAYLCQKCRKYFKRKQESQNMCKKSIYFFFGSYLEISTFQKTFINTEPKWMATRFRNHSLELYFSKSLGP